MTTVTELTEQALHNAAIESSEMVLIAMLNPRIFIDGNQWCVLYGENPQDGVCGFGDSPRLAVYAFNKAWDKKNLSGGRMTTDNKTLAVDVRQWLGDERFMYSPGTQSRAKCDEAFAAVAELIAADEEYNRAREAWLASPGKHDEFQATRDAWKRRMKALVRVKGEAA